jgi:hypothetical protein
VVTWTILPIIERLSLKGKQAVKIQRHYFGQYKVDAEIPGYVSRMVFDDRPEITQAGIAHSTDFRATMSEESQQSVASLIAITVNGLPKKYLS